MTASLDGNVVFDALDDARPLANGAFALDTETGPLILSTAELVDLRARARANADAAARRVEADLDVLIDAYAYQRDTDDAQPIAATASHILGDVEPFEAELRETLGYAKAALGRYRRLAAKGELGAAMKELEAAELAVRTADRAWAAVRDGIEGGAGEAIETLEHTRNAAALTVGVLAVVASGGAATAMITGGTKTGAATTAMFANGIATAAPALAAAGEAGARLHAGLPVDWARLGKDAAMDILLSRFGGRIANGVFDKLAGHPALRGITRVAFARIVSTVLAHEGVTTVSTTVDHLFERARGKAVTWAQLADQLVARLTDPKGAAIAAVFGAVAASASARVRRLEDPDVLAGAREPWPAHSEVNPRRRLGRAGRTKNCARCAIALDASLAGRPATALPGGPHSPRELAWAMDMQPEHWIRTGSREVTEGVLRYLGAGARVIVLGARSGREGHFFNGINVKGEARFLDGQTHTTNIDWDDYSDFAILVTGRGNR